MMNILNIHHILRQRILKENHKCSGRSPENIWLPPPQSKFLTGGPAFAVLLTTRWGPFWAPGRGHGPFGPPWLRPWANLTFFMEYHGWLENCEEWYEKHHWELFALLLQKLHIKQYFANQWQLLSGRLFWWVGSLYQVDTNDMSYTGVQLIVCAYWRYKLQVRIEPVVRTYVIKLRRFKTSVITVSFKGVVRWKDSTQTTKILFDVTCNLRRRLCHSTSVERILLRNRARYRIPPTCCTLELLSHSDKLVAHCCFQTLKRRKSRHC